MGILASKAPFSTSLSSASAVSSTGPSPSSVMPATARRLPPSASSVQTYPSPTESDFSDLDTTNPVKHWDEGRVGEYLRSIGCGEYEKLLRKNNINGENLLELDKAVLQEMGIDKVGDRVRLFLGVKKLRNRALANQKKRNRDSFAGLDMYVACTSVDSAVIPSSRSTPTSAAYKRYSRQIDLSAPLDTGRQQRLPAGFVGGVAVGSGSAPSRMVNSASDGPSRQDAHAEQLEHGRLVDGGPSAEPRRDPRHLDRRCH